jgi:benzoylsuccinyl-CoA thiolase BbsB subunit
VSEVFVVGAGMIPFGRHHSSSYPGLAVPAALAALAQAGIDRTDVETVVAGHSFGGPLVGQRIAKELGLGGLPVVNAENACSGGATAMHLAVAAVSTGRARIALVLGVDKLTQFGGGTLPLPAEDWEARRGVVMPAIYAMRARRYLHEREATVEDLAAVAVKARRHGALNPYAQQRTETTVADVLASRPIADPLTLFQCCPTGDGAAAVVVVSADVAAGLAAPAVRVAASVLHSGTVARGHRDMTWPEISVHSARDAYAQAGIGPDDLDVVELHDAFTIAELVYYEALGLCERGGAVELLRSGDTALGGKTVVNPSGGLLAKGHPVGASGAAQLAEAYWQLTGTAGDRQVPHARFALTHVTGGGISGLDHGACAVHILEAAR